MMLNFRLYRILAKELWRLRVRVFYHDKCFDGACSASLFTRFHRECIDQDAAYEYHGLVHRAGALFDESEFTGDENAIVDFKYSASPRITWWFDHHLSAFLTPQDHENFLACQRDPVCGSHKFFDPELHLLHQLSGAYRIDEIRLQHGARGGADSLGQHRGWRAVREPGSGGGDGRAGDEADADHRVDAGPGVYSAADSAADGDAAGRGAGAAVCGDAAAAAAGAAQGGDRADSQPQRRSATARSSSTSPTSRWKDSTSSSRTTCIPQATYSIGLSKSSFRTKVAVGSNPWTKADPAKMVNLAQVCERYGGGGHARVGAISFPPDQADKARQAAAEIVAELRAKNPMK